MDIIDGIWCKKLDFRKIPPSTIRHGMVSGGKGSKNGQILHLDRLLKYFPDFHIENFTMIDGKKAMSTAEKSRVKFTGESILHT